MWGMETTGLLISAVLMSLPQVASNPAPNLQTTNHTLTTYPVILTEHALCVCVCVCVCVRKRLTEVLSHPHLCGLRHDDFGPQPRQPSCHPELEEKRQMEEVNGCHL